MTDAARLQARRDAILEGMLPNVAFDGWTERALQRGAEAAGADGPALLRAFPDGARDAVRHFSDWADREMLARMAADHGFAVARTRDKIAACVSARLAALEPHREALRRAIGWLAVPGRAGLAARLGWATADRAWVAAGDRSTDYNYYTKRALLAGLFAAVTLHWLGDRSEGLAATQAFLRRRIEDLLAVGKRAGQLAGPLGRLGELPWRAAAALRRRMRPAA